MEAALAERSWHPFCARPLHPRHERCSPPLATNTPVRFGVDVRRQGRWLAERLGPSRKHQGGRRELAPHNKAPSREKRAGCTGPVGSPIQRCARVRGGSTERSAGRAQLADRVERVACCQADNIHMPNSAVPNTLRKPTGTPSCNTDFSKPWTPSDPSSRHRRSARGVWVASCIISANR